MESCWTNPDGSDKYYYHGAPFGELPPARVDETLMNVDRSSFVGTIKTFYAEAELRAIDAGRVIPKYMTVRLSGPASVGYVLINTATKVKLVVNEHDAESGTYHVQYYAGHWNTPTSTQVFDDGNSISEIVSITIDAFYVDGVTPSGFFNSVPTVSLAIADVTVPYAATLDLDLSDALATAAAFSRIDSNMEGSIDFSGVSFKYKAIPGESLSEGQQNSVFTSGGSNWANCDVQGDDLVCPFGNLDTQSVDRDSIAQALMRHQNQWVDETQPLINDAPAFHAYIQVNAERYKTEWNNLRQLMGPRDARITESGVYKIDLNTGDYVWAHGIDGMITWGPKTVSQTGAFDGTVLSTAYEQATQMAPGDNDFTWVNILANGDILAAGKGGQLIRLTSTGDARGFTYHARGTPDGRSAPGNHGGVCNVGGVVMAYACGTATSNLQVIPDSEDGERYVWVTSTGPTLGDNTTQKVREFTSTISAWDSETDTMLWQKVLYSTEEKNHKNRGISCIGDYVIYSCKIDQLCAAHHRSGEVLSDFKIPLNPTAAMGITTFAYGNELVHYDRGQNIYKLGWTRPRTVTVYTPVSAVKATIAGGFVSGDNPDSGIALMLVETADTYKKWTTNIPVPDGSSGFFFTILMRSDYLPFTWGDRENLSGLLCGDPDNYNDRNMQSDFESDDPIVLVFGTCESTPNF